MNKHVLAALGILCLALAPAVRAQVPVNYSVIKTTASLSAFAQAANNIDLVKITFTTKMLINMALDQPIDTPVPPNIILGFAGDFAKFGDHVFDPTGPAQLVVFNTTTQAKVKTIGIASNRTAAQNAYFNKYKRVAVSTLTLQNTGGTTNGTITSGTLNLGGSVTRGPNSPNAADPAKLTVNCTVNAVGPFVGFYKKSNSGVQAATFIVTKGAFRGTGKIVGQFTE